MKIGVLSSYLKLNIRKGMVILSFYTIFFLVFYLYSLPIEAVLYASLLTVLLLVILSVRDFAQFYHKHIKLMKLRDSITISNFMFPSTQDLIEKDYQELIKILDKNRADLICSKDRALHDMIEYYTIWAHQIKTPIAAMRLLLQSEQSASSSELSDQLFKIEQYVEMVLQYLRMENMSADLMFKKYSLDNIVKQAVRKYSKSFIRKKIKLNYAELESYVLTDEKWLVFVIEQILSNALKYTNQGEISIYMDKDLKKTLVIEDTGIGIEPEDLPRVFEKGFTGYNGRSDKKSTGIGLYLCKQILNKLSHEIRIESQVGAGTKVKIGLDVWEIQAE